MKKYVIIIILGVLAVFGVFECPIYAVLGVPCPACGMTRAYKALFCGDIKGAFLMHPLFLVPPLFLLKSFRKRNILIFIACVFFAVYLARMLLMFPDLPPMNYNFNSVIGEFLK